MAIVRKMAKIITDILIFTVFALLIVIIGAKAKALASNTPYFEIFGYSIFNVVTGSMEPTIYKNDVIIDKKENDYKIDDVVTYIQDGEYITHRIISINGDSIITQGDNNNTPDRNISKSDIIGKVVKIMPNAGIWQKILTTPTVMIAIFVTLILFDFAFSFKGFNKKEVVTESVKVEPIEVPVEETKKVVEETIEMPMLKGEIKKKLKELDEDYTIRLDLTRLHDEIDLEMKEED